jgi:hypothetical protein
LEVSPKGLYNKGLIASLWHCWSCRTFRRWGLMGGDEVNGGVHLKDILGPQPLPVSLCFPDTMMCSCHNALCHYRPKVGQVTVGWSLWNWAKPFLPWHRDGSLTNASWSFLTLASHNLNKS